MTTGNIETTKKKQHALASVAAFISVILVGCVAVVFGPLLIITLILYRCFFPKRDDIEREMKDKQWQLKHAMLVSRQ